MPSRCLLFGLVPHNPAAAAELSRPFRDSSLPSAPANPKALSLPNVVNHYNPIPILSTHYTALQ